ncbi:hypothetical protein COB57_01015 [Candidatus Peregrinibacteria bacterium]|nr:MAG: hypothetical protein COB57_01015 [Candidatus Peregrinibacteria bacterium]
MKNFQKWNALKIQTDKKQKVLYFHSRQIWFASLGENIGFEQSGKGDMFLRPIVILKKFNKQVLWALPLSTNIKHGKYYYPIQDSGGKMAVAILSQIKLIDAKRLCYRIGYIKTDEFFGIKKAIVNLLMIDDGQ